MTPPPRKNPWFNRTVLFNILFVVLASLVPQAVFFGLFAHAYDDEVRSNGLADAAKIEYVARTLALDPITAVYPQNFSDINANRALTEPLDYPEGRDPYRIVDQIQALRDILTRTPLVEDIWVYYTQAQLWIHATGWTNLADPNLPKDFEDQWFHEMTTSPPGQRWVVRQAREPEGTVPVLDQITVAPGLVVAVEVRTSALDGILASGLGVQDPRRAETVFLVHKDWGVVARGGAAAEAPDPALEVWNQGQGPTSDARSVSVHGQSFSVGVQGSQAAGWTLLTLRPVQNLDNRFFQMQIFVLAFGLALLGIDLLIVWYLNRRVNRPLLALLETLRKIGEKNRFPDWDAQVTLVPQTFPYWLAGRLDDLQGTVDRNQDTLRSLSLLGLLKGRQGVSSTEEAELLVSLGLGGQEAAAFTVIVDRPAEIGVQDWLEVKAQVSRTLAEALVPRGTVLVDEDQDVVGVLAAPAGGQAWAVLEAVAAATAAKTGLGLRIAVGGQRAADGPALARSFQESQDFAAYAFLVEYGTLLDGPTLHLDSRRDFALKTGWIEQFSSALKRSQAEALTTLVAELVTEITGGRYTAVSVRDTLAEVVYQVRMHLLPVQPDFEQHWGFDLASYRDLPRLSDFPGWFASVVSLAFPTGTEKGDGGFVLSRAIEAFVAENLYNDLSLVSVADGLHLNPSYLSRIFKGVMGVSFWDYVTEAKLSRAEELVKEGKLSVKELSYRLGYRSVQHFIKLFKARTGATPVEFRHRQENGTTARNS